MSADAGESHRRGVGAGSEAGAGVDGETGPEPGLEFGPESGPEFDPEIEVEIGPFRAGDAERAAELEVILFPRQDPWSRQQFLDTLEQPHVRMWAARARGDAAGGPSGGAGGNLVGFAVLAAFGPAGDREFEVFDIAVDPEFQGLGIGRALLRSMLGVADAESAPVHLEVATGNVAARTLYEAHGFAAVGLRRNYYRPSGEDAYAMVRSGVMGEAETEARGGSTEVATAREAEAETEEER